MKIYTPQIIKYQFRCNSPISNYFWENPRVPKKPSIFHPTNVTHRRSICFMHFRQSIKLIVPRRPGDHRGRRGDHRDQSEITPSDLCDAESGAPGQADDISVVL